MGTDIHGVFQRHDPATNTWVDIPHNYEQNRHYQLFAVLADVRNGYGFAGVVTGEPVKPIANPRGYPADFQVKDDIHRLVTLEHMDPRRRSYRERDPEGYTSDGEDILDMWMGDHSHSWLISTEMLTWYAAAPVVVQAGILSRSEYEAWDKTSQPNSYCGGVSGPNVVIVDDDKISMEATPGWTYVRCHWDQKLAGELNYFFAEVKRLADEHGTVRFVFGFDS